MHVGEDEDQRGGGENERQDESRIGQGIPRSSRGWTIAYAILSIVAGIIVLFSPLLTAVWLWLFIGISLVVFGVVQVVRGMKLRR